MDNFTIGLRFSAGPVNFITGMGGPNPCMFPASQQLLQAWMPPMGCFAMPGYMQAPPFFMPMAPDMACFPQPDPGWGSPFPFMNPFQGMGSMQPYQPPANPAYGHYQPSVPNHGAGYRYPEYAAIQQRARENGTLDGTPVTPYSSFPEDQFHTDVLSRLNQRAAGRVMDEARMAPPREFNALQRNEGQLQQYVQDQNAQGRGFSPAEINRLRAQGIETLYQDGQVGQGVGQANREYMELLEAWERSEANQQLKYGMGPQAGLSPGSFQQSPFNPQRQAPPQQPPQQHKPPQHKPPTAQQLQDVRRLDPPPAKTEAKPPAKPDPKAPVKAEAPKPDAQKPAAKPYDANKDSNELYKSMHGGLTGWGTDEGALFKALEGKSPEQIAKIKANYKDHYGKDLDADIKSELSGKDLSRAQSLLKGNQSAADATAIQQAVGTLWNDDKAIQHTLSGKTAEQRQAIAAEYKKQTGKELRTDLTREMSGADRDQALANLDGNQAKSDAARLEKAMKGMGTDEAAIMATLQGKNADERAAIMKSYKDTYGVDLKQRLAKDLSGSELDQANALLAGDNAKAAAAQIKTATGGWGTDEKSLNAALEGKSAEERKAITEAYQQKYGKNLNAELKDELSGNDLQKSQALLERGKLSDAEQLKFALEGAGTDEEAVKAALTGKSKEEIAKLRQDYTRLTGRELDTDIAGDMGGRELFDARQSLKGRAETVDEAVARANEVHEFERGGEGNSFSRGFVDMFSDKGELLDKNTSRVNESKAKFDRLVSEGRLNEANAEKKRLQELTGFATADVESYREAKDSAADTAGTVAATAAGVAVVVASAGTATPLVATVAMAAGAGATARVVTAGAIQGDGYGVENALSDAGRGAIDGGTAIIGMGAGKAATTAGKEVVEQTVTQRIIQVGAQGVKDGAAGGAIGAGASEAINDGTWDDGVLNGLGKVATSTAIGGTTGALVGGGVGGGMVAGKEAAVGLKNVAVDASAGLRQAGQELRAGAEEAATRLRQAGQDLRTSTQDGVTRLRDAGQEALDNFKVRTAPPEVTVEAPPAQFTSTRTPDMEKLKLEQSFVEGQNVRFAQKPSDLADTVKKTMGDKSVIAPSGYSAAPEGYGDFAADYMKNFTEAADSKKVGFLTSPTADAGSIDAATSLAAQKADAPMAYVTADDYLGYVDPKKFPGEINQARFAETPKFSLPDGETYSQATGQLSNGGLVLGGRNAAVTDWMNGVTNGNRMAVATDLPIKNAAWDPVKGRVDNASAYLQQMVKGDHTGIDMTNPFNKQMAEFVEKNADRIQSQVRFVGGSPQDSARDAAGWLTKGRDPIKTAAPEIKAPPEVKTAKTPPELSHLDIEDAPYKGAGEWGDGPVENGFQTRMRKVTDAEGNEWTQVQARNGPRQERFVNSTDGGPNWKETDNGWFINRTREVPASDGGPNWTETDYKGKLSRSRSVPDADGKGPWTETSSSTGTFKQRTYVDEKGASWLEAIQGENRWRNREGGAFGLQNEARKMGEHTLTIPGPSGPLEVKVFGKSTPEQLKLIQDALADVPEAARKYGKEIYLNRDLGNILNAKGKPINGIGGLAGDGRVLLDAGGLTNRNNVREVLFHEMGHNADYGNGTLSSNSKIWGGKSISDYGGLNAAEDFAEIHGAVLNSWDSLSDMPASRWKTEPFAAKKMEIVKFYGGKVPSAEELAAIPDRGGIFGSFSQWFGGMDQNQMSQQLGVSGSGLGDAVRKFFFGMGGGR